MTEIAFEAWLTLFAEHDVKFVVVGGFAGVLHGAGRPTLDLDVVPAWTQSNLELLVEREITNWNTDIGPIDVLVGIPDDQGLPVTFETLREHAQTIVAFDRAITVASLDHIITSKEYANRRKDAEALPELRRLRDAQQQ